MMRFTDSSFEMMMTQKPKSGRPPITELPDLLPDDQLYKGCAYGEDKPCVGICMKKLQKKEEPR